MCFLVNAASFVAVVASLPTLDRSRYTRPSPPHARRGQLREGLRYVARHPGAGRAAADDGLVGCLAYEFQVSLPVHGQRGLPRRRPGFGFMTAAMGVGAVFGGLLVAAPRTDRHRGR